MSQKFRNLEVWQISHELAREVYLEAKKMSNLAQFTLVNQMVRSIQSVCWNIVEGTSKTSDKEKIHFLNTAYSSLMEFVSQAELAKDVEELDREKFRRWNSTCTSIEAKLHNLSNFFKKTRSEAAGQRPEGRNRQAAKPLRPVSREDSF
jgi:four helix bundle protein